MRSKMFPVIIVLTIVMVSTVASSYVQKREQYNRRSVVTAQDNGDTAITVSERLKKDRVVSVHTWNVTAEDDMDEHNLLCIIRAFESHPNYEGRGVLLSVFDESKKLIYEDEFTSVGEIRSMGGRYDSPPQLILDVNYGGNADFLQILGYRNGKVTEMLNEMNGSGYEIRPQFRSSVTPAKENLQVILIGDGLAGPDEKFASVYRYKNSKYVYVGKYSQRKADDFIERSLSK